MLLILFPLWLNRHFHCLHEYQSFIQLFVLFSLYVFNSILNELRKSENERESDGVEIKGFFFRLSCIEFSSIVTTSKWWFSTHENALKWEQSNVVLCVHGTKCVGLQCATMWKISFIQCKVYWLSKANQIETVFICDFLGFESSIWLFVIFFLFLHSSLRLHYVRDDGDLNLFVFIRRHSRIYKRKKTLQNLLPLFNTWKA